MKAMVVERFGSPLVEREVPEPRLAEHMALVEVAACGVCQSDVKVSRGQMSFSSEESLPLVPGHEVSGVVVATEPEGAIPVGTRVIVSAHQPCGQCARCLAGQPQLCSNLEALGFTVPGGFQEFIAVPLQNVIRIPDSIDLIHAAPIGCSVGTAYRATITRGSARPGKTIGVIGLGGVGLHALQFARLAGGVSVGIDVSATSIEAARSLGHPGYSFDEAAELARSREFFGLSGEGLDLVLDCVGRPQTFELGASLLRKGGRLVVVGYGHDSHFTMPSSRLALDELEVLGSRNVTPPELDSVVNLVATGQLSIVVGRVEPLRNVNSVIDELEAGESVGRSVLSVGVS